LLPVNSNTASVIFLPVIVNENFNVIDGPYYKTDKEIVGGYLIMQATDLPEVTSLIKSCPVFELDGFAEIREMM